MTSNNIILFPLSKKDPDDEIIAITEDVMSDLLVSLSDYGVDLYEVRDVGLVAETIVSAIKRTKGIDHPLQEFADEYIRIVD